MRARKIMSVLMSGVLVLSLAACGNTAAPDATDAGTTTTEVTDTQETTETSAPAAAEFADKADASITFADGNFAFIGSDTSANPAAKETAVELDGSYVKAYSPDGSKIYAGIQMDKLLGDKISDVAEVEIGLETVSDGAFSAKSGKIYSFIGGVQNSEAWSIYVEKSNPKAVTASISGAAEGDYLVLSLEDSGSGDVANAALLIHYIDFRDASGNSLAVDSSVAWEGSGGGIDRSNLFGLANAITVEGLTGSGDGWAQIGYQELTDEEFEALSTPGSVVEISYSADTGSIWMGLSGDNWLRIGVGDADGSGQGYAYYNSARNIAQITYEDIAAVCGDDSSAWDKSIFIESDGPYEVFSVQIGQQASNLIATNTIDLGISGAGDGWGQIGYQELSEEQLEALQTEGSIVVVEYSSESGDLWIGLSGDNWQRVGVGDADGSGSVDALTDGNKCYVTYDMIAEVCGDDPTAWDKSIFVESDTAFEVYSVKVGTAAEVIPNNRQLDLELTGAGDGWGQIGYQELTDEQLEALQTEGSVVVVEYSSESGDLWIGLSGDNWQRVGVGDADGSGSVDAITDGSKCYVTYDMIAEVCGADTSAWDKSIFVESDTAFEVYSVRIGQTK